LRQILFLLDTAFVAEDMNAPGLKLNQLNGDLAGLYAVSVSGNWRVIFRFEDNQATDVDLIDYHEGVTHDDEDPLGKGSLAKLLYPLVFAPGACGSIVSF
jgi:mRNA-degrading endonuclease YafQ of YafQ-DinJ toxin-antitoxin module